jgi:hypothetical protein
VEETDVATGTEAAKQGLWAARAADLVAAANCDSKH